MTFPCPSRATVWTGARTTTSPPSPPSTPRTRSTSPSFPFTTPTTDRRKTPPIQSARACGRATTPPKTVSFTDSPPETSPRCARAAPLAPPTRARVFRRMARRVRRSRPRQVSRVQARVGRRRAILPRRRRRGHRRHDHARHAPASFGGVGCVPRPRPQSAVFAASPRHRAFVPPPRRAGGVRLSVLPRRRGPRLPRPGRARAMHLPDGSLWRSLFLRPDAVRSIPAVGHVFVPPRDSDRGLHRGTPPRRRGSRRNRRRRRTRRVRRHARRSTVHVRQVRVRPRTDRRRAGARHAAANHRVGLVSAICGAGRRWGVRAEGRVESASEFSKDDVEDTPRLARHAVGLFRDSGDRGVRGDDA